MTTTLSPKSKIYIPFLYLIWADGLLTQSELAIVKRVIKADKQLSEVEQVQLLQWLDADHPPAEHIFEDWKHWIENTKLRIDPEVPYPLAQFAIARSKSEDTNGLNQAGIEDIEHNLGIQAQQYKHLFSIVASEPPAEKSFDVPEMKKLLHGDSTDLSTQLAEMWESPLFQWQYHSDKEVHRDRVRSQLHELSQQGFGGISYPKEYGGQGDIIAYSKLFEQLIFADGSLSIKYGVQTGLFGGSVANLGSKKHHDMWLEGIGQGKIKGCFAMTEENHGSNVRGLKTTATYIPAEDSIEINTPNYKDHKTYIGHALDSELATVFAQLLVDGVNCGVHAIVVPLRNTDGELLPGIEAEDNGYKLGLNGVDNGKLWFHQVKVPASHLLDRFGGITKEGRYESSIQNPDKRFFITLGTLIGGRICVAKGANSGAKLGLAIALGYAHKRRQFGPDRQTSENLLMDYPSHQMRLIPRLAKSYAIHFALDHLMQEYSDTIMDTDKRKLETQAAALKVMASDHANETLQECREACGGKGYMSENRIPQLRADIDIFSTFEGDNHVLLQLAAKGVLSEFQTEFNAESFLGVMKYLRRNVEDTMVNYNRLYTNKIDANHLLGRDFHKEAITYRRRRLTFSLAQRMQKLFKKRIKPYQVFLKTQTHMLVLAKAYAEELVLTSMHQAIEKSTTPKETFMLKKLSAMYALHTILEHKSWYLEQGYISANKSKAIRQLVHRQAQILTPDSMDLIAAFNIPKASLDLPILQE